MHVTRIPTRLAVAPVVIASLACLQPGIDPVFLTLLTSAHAVPPANHGWIVGATQLGMAAGSLLTWRLSSRLPNGLFPAAVFCALIASLATAQVDDVGALLAIRGGYGIAMGINYTQAMSLAAIDRPNGAYGAVFLLQLILSSLVALLLPAVSDAAGPRVALAVLGLAPLAALLLTLAVPMSRRRRREAAFPPSIHHETRHPVDGSAWSLAAAALLFICATMMVWSFVGALAIGAGIDEDIIGQAVAVGSIAGALTALAVMREQPVVPPLLTGLFAGLSLLSPVAAVQTGSGMAFIGSVILLNIGSTAIIIRTSGLASAGSRDPLFRRLVACTHPLGMIIGPVIGSVATSLMGTTGLLIAAIATISAAVGAFGISQRYGRLLQLQPADLDELRPVSPTAVLPVLQGGDI